MSSKRDAAASRLNKHVSWFHKWHVWPYRLIRVARECNPLDVVALILIICFQVEFTSNLFVSTVCYINMPQHIYTRTVSVDSVLFLSLVLLLCLLSSSPFTFPLFCSFHLFL